MFGYLDKVDAYLDAACFLMASCHSSRRTPARLAGSRFLVRLPLSRLFVVFAVQLLATSLKNKMHQTFATLNSLGSPT